MWHFDFILCTSHLVQTIKDNRTFSGSLNAVVVSVEYSVVDLYVLCSGVYLLTAFELNMCVANRVPAEIILCLAGAG